MFVESVLPTSWHDDWSKVSLIVLGSGVSGFAIADTLTELGANFVVVADSVSDDTKKVFDVLGVKCFIADSLVNCQRIFVEQKADAVFVSPGIPPSNELVKWFTDNSVPVFGETDLAWCLRDKFGTPAPWFVVTGTNGKTTVSNLLAHIFVSAGIRAVPVGNIGVPILDALRDPAVFEVLVVELSSFQLHYLSDSISPFSSVCLNFAEDHYDWHGDVDHYFQAKAKIFNNTLTACVYNKADAATMKMVEDADVVEGARAIGFGLGVPSVSEFGIVEEFLLDRAFLDNRSSQALELVSVSDLNRNGLASPVMIQNVLAAAALARSFGVSVENIFRGVSSFVLDSHRGEKVFEFNGVSWINDSKATNPHAVLSVFSGFSKAVWITGGVVKGYDLSDLVAAVSDKLLAICVLCTEDDLFFWQDSLSSFGGDKHFFVTVNDPVAVSDSFLELVECADFVSSNAVKSGFLNVGVLFSPATASFDLFKNYAHRGDVFVDSVKSFFQVG